MKTFYVPIEGLTVNDDWVVGPVSVMPVDLAIEELGAAARAGDRDFFKSQSEAQGAGAIAKVESVDHDGAIDLVAQAVDLLRVFQHVRYFTSHLTQFGIAGDVGRGVVPFGVTEDGHAGVGFKQRGEALGWTFDDSAVWAEASAFRWVADAIGSGVLSQSERRALVGVQLLSEAIIEQRSAFKMVGLVTALEALVLERRATSQTFQLARHIAFFGCGRHDNDLCGRDRETCPYLGLDPTTSRDLAKLRLLRRRGAEPPWRCSEWHRVVDWYDLRSDVLHGAGPDISYRQASQALWWVLRNLLEPILEWLRDNRSEPVEHLKLAIHSLPAMPDWEARLGSL